MGIGNEQVRYEVDAETSKYEKAMRRVKDMGKETTEALGAAWKVMGTSGVAAFGLITSAVVAGTRSMAEFERLQLRTNALIKATGNAAGLTGKELIDMAKAVDLNTLADRNNVLESINALQTFKSVQGDTFRRTIELSQDLAEVLGGDLQSQAIMLGKALEDPVAGLSALKEVGVSFTAEQKDTIKTLAESNRLYDAQSKILDTIAGQVGGAGAAAAGGLIGSLDTLNYRWREFSEAMANTDAAVAGVNALSRSLEVMTNILQPSKLGKAQEFFRSGLFSSDQYRAFLDAGPDQRQQMLDAAASGPAVDPHEAFRLGARPPAPPAGGGGGGEAYDPAKDKELLEIIAAHNQARLDMTQEYYDTVREIDTYEAEAAMAAAMAWDEAFLTYRADVNERRIQQERDTQRAMAELQKQGAQYKYTIAMQTGTALMKLIGVSSEKIFMMQKGVEIAQAIMAAHAAAAKALAEVPYPANIAVSAQMLATGYLHAGAIAATTIGSLATSKTGGSSATGTYAADYNTGMPEQDPAYAKEEKKPSLNIYIEGDFIGDEQYIDQLVTRINDAADRDVFVNQTRYRD